MVVLKSLLGVLLEGLLEFHNHLSNWDLLACIDTALVEVGKRFEAAGEFVESARGNSLVLVEVLDTGVDM